MAALGKTLVQAPKGWFEDLIRSPQSLTGRFLAHPLRHPLVPRRAVTRTVAGLEPEVVRRLGPGRQLNHAVACGVHACKCTKRRTGNCGRRVVAGDNKACNYGR